MKIIKRILLAFVLFLIIGITNAKATSNVVSIDIDHDMGAEDFRNTFNQAFEDVLGYSDYTIIVDGEQSDGTKSTITLDTGTPENTLLSLGSGNTDYLNNDNRWKTWSGNIIIKNLDFVGKEAAGNTKYILLRVNLPLANVIVDNCSFSKYQKAGVWAANFNSLSVINSDFNGNFVVNYDEDDDSIYDHSLFVKSSEHISLCLGDIPLAGFPTSRQIENITIKNNTFTTIRPEDNPAEGTSAIKLKIKDKAYVTGVNNFEIVNNTFINNIADLILGEKNPATGTTYEDSADLNINLSENISDNDGGLKIQWVNQSSDPYKTIANGSTGLLEGISHDFASTITQNEDGTRSIENIEDLSEILAEYKNDNPDSTAVFKIEEEDYEITFSASDIKSDLTDTVSDLSLNISTDIPKDLEDAVPEGSVIISSTASGDLPVNKITVKTKVEEFAGKDVELYYYNETTKKLELVGTYKADDQGNIAFELTHFSQYVLSLKVDKPEAKDNNEELNKDEDVVVPTAKENKKEEKLPKTGDPIMLFAVIGMASLAAIGVTAIRIKKYNN